jgi:uncharacterized protein
MITPIDARTLPQIKNPALAAYAQRYLDIAQDYLTQVTATGIELDPHDYRPEVEQRLTALRQTSAPGAAPVTFRNQDKSLVVNAISPACEACATGAGSITYFVSLRCHRSCFYCFNPNQEGYDYHLDHQRDLPAELERLHARRQKVRHLALTGGEPLLYPEQALEFFRTARRLFPEAYTRLYTSGDHASDELLQQLHEAGLDEIRFSIRMHDLAPGQRHTLERIAAARLVLPHVMVEMPILPGILEPMQAILLEIDRLGVDGINLLEFCYPLNNADEFNRRGYQVKNPPHEVYYNYWYAGGLPVAGSELVCLDLLAFAAQQGLALGVHYCSLENKHTGQLYQQNARAPLGRIHIFSERDYFLKSAKVFGADIEPVERLFKRQNFCDYERRDDLGYLEFPVRKIHTLRRLDLEVGLSYQVHETEGGESLLREVKVDYTTTSTFDAECDI